MQPKKNKGSATANGVVASEGTENNTFKIQTYTMEDVVATCSPANYGVNEHCELLLRSWNIRDKHLNFYIRRTEMMGFGA